MTGIDPRTAPMDRAPFGDIDAGGGGCFGESVRSIIDIHTPTAGLRVAFDMEVLDVLADRPAGSREIFDCLVERFEPYRVFTHIEAEREFVLSQQSERGHLVDPAIQARAERCGARSAIERADRERLARFEEAFLERHRESLEASLSLLQAATDATTAILSGPLEPIGR